MLCQMTPRSFLDGRIQLWGGVNRAVTHSSLTCGLVPRCSPVFVWQSKLALCYSLLVAPEGNSSWLHMHVLKHSAKSSLSHNVYCWLPLLWKNRRKKSPVIGHVRVVCLLTSAALWAQIKGWLLLSPTLLLFTHLLLLMNIQQFTGYFHSNFMNFYKIMDTFRALILNLATQIKRCTVGEAH